MQMAKFTLQGSGGSVVAELTDEQVKKADLGVGKLFLAPVGRLEPDKIFGHSCKTCEKEFDGPPRMNEESTSEEVADNLVLVGRGQYVCQQCDSIIGEYRIFKKHDESGNIGMARKND